MHFQPQLETITINQCGSLVNAAASTLPRLPKLTLHGDLDGAVLLPHVVARRAPVDSGALHGEIPQSHKLRVLEICGIPKKKQPIGSAVCVSSIAACSSTTSGTFKGLEQRTRSVPEGTMAPNSTEGYFIFNWIYE